MENKKITYKIINEFNTDNTLKEDFKLLFNKKLLNLILSIEKDIFNKEDVEVIFDE